MKFSRLVAAGVFLSVASHAAISAYFAPDPDQVEIAASEGGAVSVIGSLEDLVAGTDGALEAVEAPPEEIQPVENAPELAAVQPVQAPQTRQDVEKAVQVQTATIEPTAQGVTDTRQVTAETVPPETPHAAPRKAPIEALKAVEPQKETAATSPKTEVAAATPPVLKAEAPETNPITPEPPVQPVIQETVEAKPAKALEAATPAPPVKPKAPKKQKVAKLQAQKKKTPGSDRNARRGGEQITGKTGGSNANGRKDGKSNDGGTKARSNYNGKVLVKLRRAKRYPTQARREHLQGTVTVRFTVARSGAVSGIRLARSSGHTLLDQAALEMVHRAAPMPKVPDDIRGSTLSFTVPVRFSR
ncbi:energy transducer TonB [Roseibium aggregatum]|uniref:TonB family protein n=1 Tax=Roseibium aggregatum TaxID=187304 RepID=A0A926P012_9HYPH|nr:energy transducer TonB [Roseibium aggregatum]MBD1548609.1 TonB family protein [Roseibium aggregatum]